MRDRARASLTITITRPSSAAAQNTIIMAQIEGILGRLHSAPAPPPPIAAGAAAAAAVAALAAAPRVSEPAPMMPPAPAPLQCTPAR